MTIQPGILVGDTLTVYVDGKSYSVHRSNPHFPKVKDAWKTGRKDLVKWLDVASAVNKFTKGKVEIKYGQVYYNDQPIHNVVVDRILEFMREGLPTKPLMKFLENLMANPSENSRNELYKFLEHKFLPISEDGHVLAYKAIRNDWKDKHTASIDNSIGKIVSMDRKLVDDNSGNHCSSGLHVGSLDYVTGFASDRDRIVVVSFDPMDAVSVPNDANCTKLRVCKYKVVAEYKGELDRPVYNNNVQPLEDDDYYNEDDIESYDEDDDYWCYDCYDQGCNECEDEQQPWDKSNESYGLKPDGSKFHNLRDSSGRFVKKS